MPGIYATLGDEIDALRRVAGDKIVGFIKEEVDPFVQERCSQVGTSQDLKPSVQDHSALIVRIPLMN